MASVKASDFGLFLDDRDIKIYDPNIAFAAILTGATGRLRPFLFTQAERFRELYQGKVAKKTGRLSRSAEASVEVRDVEKGQARIVGKVTVGGTLPVSRWRKGPFYYGVLHELGADGQVREHPAAKDLREIVLQNTKRGA